MRPGRHVADHLMSTVGSVATRYFQGAWERINLMIGCGVQWKNQDGLTETGVVMGYPRHEDGQYIKVRKVFTKDSLARENHDPKALKVSQKMLDWECIETDVIINDFPCSSIERRVHIMSQDTWAVHLSSTGRHFRTVGIATHHAANEGEESAPSTRAVLPSMLAGRSCLDTRSIEGPPSLIPRKWKFFNVNMGTPYQRYDVLNYMLRELAMI